SPPRVDPHVAAFDPPALLQCLPERSEVGLSVRAVRCGVHQHANAPHGLHRLRVNIDRPSGGCATQQGDELAALHSIISSARAKSVCGISIPKALAVLRLTTSSTLDVCMTGRSAGLSPLKIRPT